MRPKKLYTVCVGCGGTLKLAARARNPKKWCTEACRLRHYRSRNPEYVERQAQLASQRHLERYVPSRHDLKCVACGEGFVGVHASRQYCSQTCRNRAFNARRRADGRAAEMSANRRAREKGAKVSRTRRSAVLEADNFICHLCDLPTDPNVEYPHPDYPVVDHVTPLSLGGEHDPNNWRCAHNSCNSKRGSMTVEAFRELLTESR